MLCKESVITLPVVGWIAGGRPTTRRLVPLLAISVVFAALFALLRPQGLAPNASAYAIRWGSNLFHNLMTYTVWAVNVVDPMPDRISSFDPSAWRIGMAVTGFLVLAWSALPGIRRMIGVGLAWWLLGLLPVLPLESQTYRHYVYPALPGLALAIAASVAGLLGWRLESLAGSPRAARSVAVAGGVALAGLAIAYGLRAEHLIVERLTARLPNFDLALDPTIRRRDVALRALTSLAPVIGRGGPGAMRIAILSPEGAGRLFGARSGREYARPPAGQHARSLIDVSLNHGWVVRLFFPQVDSVAFVSRWSPADRDFLLFLPYQDGTLEAFGSGPEAARRLQLGLAPQVSDYLRSVLEVSDDPALRLAYAVALAKAGERDSARAVLHGMASAGGSDSTGRAAERLLRSLEGGRTPH
jgi:hypothetical protein